MAKKITLVLTPRQFEALVCMIEENASSIGSADPEFANHCERNLKHLRKAFKDNSINYNLSG